MESQHKIPGFTVRACPWAGISNRDQVCDQVDFIFQKCFLFLSVNSSHQKEGFCSWQQTRPADSWGMASMITTADELQRRNRAREIKQRSNKRNPGTDDDANKVTNLSQLLFPFCSVYYLVCSFDYLDTMAKLLCLSDCIFCAAVLPCRTSTATRPGKHL